MQSHTARIGITQPLCATCATPLAPGIVACPICGRIVDSSASADAPVLTLLEEPLPTTQPCPGCGHPLLPGARGCPACGRAKAMVVSYRPLPAPGELLEGRYRVVRHLDGGMSSLLLARDEKEQGKQVVLKLALDHVQGRALKREASVLTDILHPSMPRTSGKFFYHGNDVLVLEYIDGFDLEQRLTRVDRATGLTIPGKAYPLTTVLNWGAQLCQLLHLLEQFSSGAIIHHDIKPANIICVSAENTLVLIDWGAARHTFSQSFEPGKPGLEVSGTYGTVGYAPPEQYRGESTIRSDIYALAATLYHLATDDDPSAHPFVFPRLGELGAFGWLLGQALSRQPTERPSAAQLGAKCMALLRLQGETLHAPDGTALHSPAALADWCCTHWEATRSWLARGLPEALLMWWPTYKHDVDQLHALSQNRPIRDVDIDKALGFIDQRYRDAEPILSLRTPEIDFGSAQGKAPIQRSAEIRNTGRRMLHLTLDPQPAPWLQLSPEHVYLPPGATTSIQLTATPERLWGWKEQRLSLPLKSGAAPQGMLHCMIKPNRTPILLALPLVLVCAPLLLRILLGLFGEPLTPYPPIYPTATVMPHLPETPTPTASPDGSPRFYTSSSSDWRALLYMASQRDETQLSPELQRQAYEDGQAMLALGNTSLAIEAFRAAGNYADASAKYTSLLREMNRIAGVYPIPFGFERSYELERYRRYWLLHDTSMQQPSPLAPVWSQQVEAVGHNGLLIQSSVWMLLSERSEPVAYAWSIENGTQLRQRSNIMPGTHRGDLLLTAVNTTNVAAFSDADTIQINNLENGDVLKTWKVQGHYAELLDVSSDLRAIVVKLGAADGEFLTKVYLDTGEIQRLDSMLPDAQVKISSDGNTVVSLTSNGDASVWFGSKQLQFQSGGDPILHFAIAPDNSGIAFVRADGALRFFDLRDERLRWVTELPDKATGPLIFDDDARRIAVSGENHIWMLYSSDGMPVDGMLVEDMQTKSAPIVQLALSSNGRYCVAQDQERNLMLWKVLK